MNDRCIELEDESIAVLDRIAETGEHPALLVRVADIDPKSFAQFLVQTGRSRHPAGLLLWVLSAARAACRRPALKPLVEAFSTGLITAGLAGLNVALKRRSRFSSLISGAAVSSGIAVRLYAEREALSRSERLFIPFEGLQMTSGHVAQTGMTAEFAEPREIRATESLEGSES